MNELIKFEYYRILKSKVIVVMAILAAAMPFIAALALRAAVSDFSGSGYVWDEINLNKRNIRYITWFIISYFYERLPLMMALFVPLFLGRDYKDGFIRNKITAGHTRLEIFTSAVITQVTVTIALSVIYVFTGVLSSLLISGAGANLNKGEMLVRALTLLLSLIATTVFFTALSLVIKSRAGTTVIAIAFVFSFGIFSTLAVSYSYNHKMIKQYVQICNERFEEEAGSGSSSYELEEKEFFDAGWYIGHPVYVLTNAGLGKEFLPSLSSLSTDGFEYTNKIARTGFATSIISMIRHPMLYLLTSSDLKAVDGAYVKVQAAETEYNIKSALWIAIYFGSGYALFRKKNIF